MGSGLKNGIIGPALKQKKCRGSTWIIRWGGRSRLSGFLPVQSVYSDLYVVEDYWPDFKREHVEAALAWYDARGWWTLGG